MEAVGRNCIAAPTPGPVLQPDTFVRLRHRIFRCFPVGISVPPLKKAKRPAGCFLHQAGRGFHKGIRVSRSRRRGKGRNREVLVHLPPPLRSVLFSCVVHLPQRPCGPVVAMAAEGWQEGAGQPPHAAWPGNVLRCARPAHCKTSKDCPDFSTSKDCQRPLVLGARFQLHRAEHFRGRTQKRRSCGWCALLQIHGGNRPSGLYAARRVKRWPGAPHRRRNRDSCEGALGWLRRHVQSPLCHELPRN